MWKKFKFWVEGIQQPEELLVSFTDRYFTIHDREYLLTKAQLTDIDALLEVERLVYDGQTPWDNFAFNSELQKTGNHLFLVVFSGHRLVAFIGAWYSRKETHVTNIAVIPSLQHHGIGRYLMNDVIAKAEAIQSDKITLEVRITNKTAQSLYHSLGFLDRNVKKGYYAINHEDALNMCLTLNEENEEQSL